MNVDAYMNVYVYLCIDVYIDAYMPVDVCIAVDVYSPLPIDVYVYRCMNMYILQLFKLKRRDYSLLFYTLP